MAARRRSVGRGGFVLPATDACSTPGTVEGRTGVAAVAAGGTTGAGGNPISPWRWIDTVTRQLELCRATRNEIAVVLAVDTDDPELRGMVAAGLERLGCNVAEVIVRSGATMEGRDPVDLEAVALALTAADLIVDVHGSLVEESAARDEVLDQARVLALDIDRVTDLDLLVAHPGLSKRMDRAIELLGQANTVQISSHAGTLVEVRLSDSELRAESGLVVDVGDLAHWPAGSAWCVPAAEAVDGCIVAMPGDLVTESGYLMRSPVRLEISDGKVTEVLGDTADADVIRSELESLPSDEAYDVAEVGWGLNLTRLASSLGAFDPGLMAPGRGPAMAGKTNFRFGGGSKHDRGVTLTLANTTVVVDDTDLIVDGSLVGQVAPDVYERAAVP